MPKVAKLAIQSGLPQLDRIFDYLIPDSLEASIQVGSRVKVPFGNSKKALDGFVVEISSESEFAGKLSEVQAVVGDRPALRPEIFTLCSQLAERSASSLGELLKIAVPSHMPRAFAAHSPDVKVSDASLKDLGSSFEQSYIKSLGKPATRSFSLAEPRELPIGSIQSQFLVPSWVSLFLAISIENLSLGRSSIILVPDYREHTVLTSAINAVGLESVLVDYSQELPKSKQYAAYLKALDSEPRIIVGSRSAAFAPAHNLGSILVFDEADRSYIDQASPYLSTRDVVLVRQTIENCSLVFSSHSISTDTLRLIQTGYLKDQSLAFAAPRISISEPGMRVDSHAYAAIKKGLIEGAVLVQVSSLGDSTALYCSKCDESARCKVCSGPLWIEGSGSKKCRWCNAFSLDFVCDCGSSDLTLGRAGSTRTAAELGRAFPNVRVIESTGGNRLVSIPKGKILVVATAGAEPYVDGGYHAVVLLDARVLLARQNLRALEEAVRVWSNAVAKLRTAGSCVLVGVSGELAQLYSLWNHSKIALKELAARNELQLPPAVRMGSVTAGLEMVTAISEVLATNKSVVRIGPAPVSAKTPDQLWRLIFKYPYSEGLALAKQLKLEAAKISAGKARVSHSGRSVRSITVKMNDAEVV
jgi:primosomal protein N' (replication factor Y) (superfamily II helicase)